MHFTREPIVESIIAPRDGHKLLVRNCRGAGREEEYLVDALEVVSFGNALFYRYREKPKPFLLPISEYEVVEVRETRLILKNASVEKNIKISGSKEYSGRAQKGKEPKAEAESPESTEAEVKQEVAPRRERRRNRRGRRASTDEIKEVKTEESATKAIEPAKAAPAQVATVQKPPLEGEEAETTSVFSHLLTPPPQLIKDSIHLYKSYEIIRDEESSLPTETPKETKKTEPKRRSRKTGEKTPPAEEKPATTRSEDEKNRGRAKAAADKEETKSNLEAPREQPDADEKRATTETKSPEEVPPSVDLVSEPPAPGESLENHTEKATSVFSTPKGSKPGEEGID